jgi:hypothetical protein
VGFVFLLKKLPNKVLDAEPPIASFLKSMLIGGGPVNAAVSRVKAEPECVPSRCEV